MADGRHYDTLHFPDYLDGTGAAAETFWHERPLRLDAPPAVPHRQHAAPTSPATGDMIRDRCDAFARRYLGAGVSMLDFPGGRRRESWRALLYDGRSVIFTKRKNTSRTLLEARVLERLAAAGAPVPRPLHFNGLILVQQDVGRERVADPLLKGCSGSAYRSTMLELVDTLWRVYAAADQAGLAAHVPMIGHTPDWITALVDRTALIGHNVGVPCPRPDVQRLKDLFAVFEPEFVKWDARPGNAVRDAAGAIHWIDWEHCGARNRLDDLAWLLGDDVNPDYPNDEMAVIDAVMARYAAGPIGGDARLYFFAFGVHHSAVRLARILSNKGSGDWDSESDFNTSDLERVRLSEALTLCRRAARWARQAPPTRMLASWFEDVGAALEGGRRHAA